MLWSFKCSLSLKWILFQQTNEIVSSLEKYTQCFLLLIQIFFKHILSRKIAPCVNPHRPISSVTQQPWGDSSVCGRTGWGGRRVGGQTPQSTNESDTFRPAPEWMPSLFGSCLFVVLCGSNADLSAPTWAFTGGVRVAPGFSCFIRYISEFRV